jgi:hypothetical protein
MTFDVFVPVAVHDEENPFPNTIVGLDGSPSAKAEGNVTTMLSSLFRAQFELVQFVNPTVQVASVAPAVCVVPSNVTLLKALVTVTTGDAAMFCPLLVPS